jgi:hypothetical protein
VSCFCREKQYYRKEGGQDLRRKGHFAASNYVQVHSAEWFSWLKQVPSFAFHARAGGHFTARKETRARGGVYWIAYRHIGGQLVKKYIGALASVTIVHLEEIAGELEMKASHQS